MSNTDKINGIITNLSVKYSKTSWNKILPSIFKTEDFSTAMYQLVSDVQAGQQFTPLLKDMFKSFDLCPLEEVKVVFINNTPYSEVGVSNGLAFAGKQNPFTREISDISETGECDESLLSLPQKGVLLLNVSLTCPVGKSTDHLEMWKPITSHLLREIAEATVNTIFVFVGESTEYLSKEVPSSHAKLFLPSFKDEDQWESINVLERTNNILKKGGKKEIAW